jgi:fibronectin-binding autotransporter adhesin
MKSITYSNQVPRSTVLRRLGKSGLLRKLVGSSVAAFFAMGSLAPFAHAGQVWDGGAGTGNWTDGANWNVDNLVPNFGLGINFAGAVQPLTNINGATAVTSGITFDAGGAAFTINSVAGITNSGNIINNSASNQTINMGVTVGNAQTWQTNGGGTMSFGAVTLNNTLQTTANNGSINLNGAVGGGSGITHTAGTLNLANGANTFTGALLINGGTVTTIAGSIADTVAVTVNNPGTLQLGGNETIGSLAGAAGGTVNLGANTLTTGDANNTAFAGTVNGAGGLTKQGVGTFTLNGNNGYAGATAINAGTLVAGNAGALGTAAAGTTVANNASLQLANGVAIGAEALTINGNGVGGIGALTQAAGGSSSFAGAITVATNSTIGTNGAGTLTLTGGIIKTNTNLTLNGGGTININTVGISGNDDNAFNDDLIVDAATTVNLNVANTYEGPTFIRNGSTVNANVVNALPTAPGRTRIEMDAGLGNLVLGANQSIASVTSLAGQASTINLNGNTLTIGFGTAPNINGTANAVFAGVISGTGALTKDDNSRQILTGVSTYTGFTTINGGVLQVGNANVTPGVNSALGPNLVFVNAGNLDINLTNNGAINNTIFTVVGTSVRGISNAGITNTVAGPILGTGGFDQIGAGTTILTNTNLYTGPTNVNAGVLQVGNGIGGSIAAASAVTVLVGAALDLNLSANSTFGNNVANAGTINARSANINTVSGVISGNGVFNQAGTGRTIFTGANTYTGATNINAGTLQVGDGTTLNSAIALGSAITVGAAGKLAIHLAPTTNTFNNAVTNNGAVETLVSAGATNILSGIISGNGTLQQSGAGTAILTGANTYTGITTISAGTLQVGNSAAAGSLGTGNVVNNAILAFNRTDAVAVANQISGTGAVNVNSGTITLQGANTYGGITTVNNGATLVLGNVTALGTTVGGTVVADGGTLNLNGLAIGPEAVQLGSAGAVAAVLTNTAGAAASLQGTVLIASNANINTVTAADDITLAGVVSGNNFSLNKNGAGTLILSGVNTYAGITNINTGTVQVGNASALGSFVGNTVVDGDGGAAASLDLNGFNIGLEALVLNNAGPGDLPLAGALQNSSAAAAVVGGTVNLNSSSTIGTHAGTITIDGVISGAAGANLTKTGVGTLIQNGVNTYNGQTFIQQGILVAGNAAALGAVGNGTTVNAGASLQIANGINVNAEPLTINGAGAGVAAPGALTQAAGGSSSFAGAITVASASTISTNGAGTLTLTGGIIKTDQNLTINGGGTVNVNTVGISGDNDDVFDDDLIVDAATTVNLNVANTYEGPTFIRNGSTVNANVANALPTANGRTRIEMDQAVGNLALGANQAIASLNSVNAGSTVNLNANTLTIGFTTAPNINGNAAANFTGVISGAGNIIKDDTSNQTLSGVNTYTGTTSVNAGTLTVGNNSALGTIAGNTSVAAGATLDLNGFNIGLEPLSLAGAGVGGNGALQNNNAGAAAAGGPVTLTADTTIGANTGNITLSGAIGGAFALTKIGGQTLTLSGANTYTGVTTVNVGILQLQGGAAIVDTGSVVLNAPGSLALLNNETIGRLSGNGNVNLNANTLTTGDANNTAHNGIISGAGGLTKQGTGTFTVNGANTYGGTTNINVGILVAGNAAALGAVGTGTAVANGASLQIANGINVNAEPLTINGNGVGGIGALTQDLNGSSSFAGAITVATNSIIGTNGNGVLTLTGGINKTDVNLTINGGGTVIVNAVGISGDNDNLFNDDLIVDAATTLTLNVANTYEGPTFIRNGSTVNANVANALPTANGRTRIEMDQAAGNLVLAANQSIASVTSLAGQASTINLNANTLTIGFGSGQDTNGTANANFRGVINGAGNIIKDDNSTQVFSGNNGYTGTTTINGGTLVVNGIHGAGNTAGVYNIGNNANGADVLAGTGVINLAAASSVNLLAGNLFRSSISVGDPTVAPVASILTITNVVPGNVAINMAVGSTLNVDLFTGAGNGNNTLLVNSSDRLNLTGTLASGANAGVLVVGNPLGLTGFTGGDSWLLVNMAPAGGPGNITGNLGIDNPGVFDGLNDTALNLVPTQVGNFNQVSGVYTVIDTITGIQMANIMGQSVMSAAQGMLGDVNGRLFFLRAGYGERGYDGSLNASLDSGVESGEGDMVGSDSSEWQAYLNANYNNVSIDAVGAQQAGFDSDTWTAGVGFERSITPNFTLGFAANWLESQQDFSSNVGKLDMSGISLSAYGSYVRKAFWADVLYSFGSFDIETNRNTIGFGNANGNTDAMTHAVQFNTGWNFRFQDNSLVTGPIVGVDYMHATVDGFSETSGGLAALRYNSRNYDSLISRVGWSLSKKVDTDFAKITAQVRLSYERQNIKHDNQTSVSLINQPFTPNSAEQNLGQDYMAAGAGLNFQFTPRFGVLLNYQGQFFRQSVQAHFVNIRAGFSF